MPWGRNNCGERQTQDQRSFHQKWGKMGLLFDASQQQAQGGCMAETQKLFSKRMNENCAFSSGDKVGFLRLSDEFQDLKRDLLVKGTERC